MGLKLPACFCCVKCATGSNPFYQNSDVTKIFMLWQIAWTVWCGSEAVYSFNNCATVRLTSKPYNIVQFDGFHCRSETADLNDRIFVPVFFVQICVLDGNVYDAKFLEGGKYQEGGTEPAEELEACALLYNKKKVGLQDLSMRMGD